MITRYSFEQSTEQLNGLYHLPCVPAARAGLRRAARLMELLGNPQRAFRSVHVTGSSGKGSTTTMIGSILQAAGFRTGYFRSPHLHSYRERISIDGQDIGEDEWESHFNRLWPVVQAMRDNRLPDYDLGRPSLFEVLFALMALHFAERGVEWAAVETGLGGRLDATNLLDSDVAVVTTVSLEHTHVLGNTVREIAVEKAAIIKPGSHAVTASSNPEALHVIEERARQVRAPLIRVGREVQVAVRGQSLDGQALTISDARGSFNVFLPLAGSFQATNAATAFAAARSLRDRGVPLTDYAIARGLESARVPGRLELVSQSPLILLDGAHHPAAAEELASTLRELLPGREIVLLFAAMADKNAAEIARHLAPLASRVVVTLAPGSERAASVAALQEAFESYTPGVKVEEDADEALRLALKLTRPDATLLVTGSLYLVGHVRRALVSGGTPA